MISILICFIKGHNEVNAGSCPFTGQSYNYCERCNRMRPLQDIN
jgi:hypothetical protein